MRRITVLSVPLALGCRCVGVALNVDPRYLLVRMRFRLSLRRR